MSVRARLILVGFVAVAVVLVLVLLLTSGDDGPKGEITRGMPERGFPLRGSLADDDDAIAAAVKAWREPEDDDEGDDDEAERDSRSVLDGPDENSDVTVLWAGRVDERTDVVMLEGGDLVAELTRSTSRNWFVSGTSPRDRDAFPNVPLGAGHSVIVPEGGDWRYVNTEAGPGLRPLPDGMFNGESEDNEGFVLPARPNGTPVGIYVADVGAKLMSPEAFEAFQQAVEGDDARAVWLATEEAQSALTETIEDNQQAPSELLAPQTYELVWTGRIPGHPHAAVITQGANYGRALALGYAQPDDPEDADEEPDDGSALLGFGNGSNRPDTAVGSVYYEVDEFPYLILAGIGVKTLHVLVGDREFTRRAPVAAFDARAFGEPGQAPDTVVYGRTADGEVVAPLPEP